MSGRDMKYGRESQREANPCGAEKAREGKVLSEVNSGGPSSLVDVAKRGKSLREARNGKLFSDRKPNRKLDVDR